MKKTSKKNIENFYKKRPKGQYFRKYEYGFTFVVGGSELYSGSPALSAMAALKSGADRVKIIAPERAANIAASFSPDMTALPLDGKWLNKKHVPSLLTMISSGKSVSRGNFSMIIGGGLGRSKETQEAILEILEKTDVPMVIDADALHALAEKPDVIKNENCILTPHFFEFYLLTGKKIYGLPEREKIQIIKEEAKKLGATILFKDKPDIISNGQEVALNETGSPYMSVGGTGDVLSGICGALLSRQDSGSFEAAQAAAYISGKAGEIAAQELNDSLTAVDVIQAIYKTLY